MVAELIAEEEIFKLHSHFKLTLASFQPLERQGKGTELAITPETLHKEMYTLPPLAPSPRRQRLCRVTEWRGEMFGPILLMKDVLANINSLLVSSWAVLGYNEVFVIPNRSAKCSILGVFQVPDFEV